MSTSSVRERAAAAHHGGRVAARPQRDGWTIVRQKGHTQLKHPTKPGRVTIPVHPRVVLNLKTLSTVLEQADLSVADLRRLL
jgi:predicted RNA binding protein YcfA (HicA-like mRNA interferase family)